ncbi:MAG: class I SAM-dependent methyltransferase [Oscillospiraceae bacterium]
MHNSIGEMYRAGQPKPGARLLAAVSLLNKGRVVADIGCDHGKLAVYLAMAGIAPHVIAADVRPLPLAKAAALVRQTGCKDIVECRLGNGLEPLREGEAHEVVIAGMSAETIIEILENSPVDITRLHFVFVPASRSELLRCWLLQHGFALEKEIAIEENGRYYTAFSGLYTGEMVESPSALLCELGLLCGLKDKASIGYINKRAGYLQSRLQAPLPQKEQQQLQQLLQEVQQCLN